MTTRAYYNEIDKSAATWLRELIKAGLIAPGDVDERSIEDVKPAELASYRQCHFFSGIGGWSYALRLAGWPDDRAAWTGSCPCQPFSTAGKRDGFADERHLWPAFFWLIEQCRPGVVFGEQVSGKDGLAWLDLVQADLEGIGYAVGALTFPAAGVGAPHGRHRLYFVGDADGERRIGIDPLLLGQEPGRHQQDCVETPRPGPTNGFWRDCEWLPCRDGKARAVGIVADAAAVGLEGLPREQRGSGNNEGAEGLAWRRMREPGGVCEVDSHRGGHPYGHGATEPRSIKSRIEPLAHGVAARVVRLCGYGNAICGPQAAAFVRSYMEVGIEN